MTRRRPHACNKLIDSNMTKEIINMLKPSAAAAAYLNSSSFITISNGVISVFIGRLPEMNITEPYSPTPRANAIVKPVNSAGITVGKMMRRKM